MFSRLKQAAIEQAAKLNNALKDQHDLEKTKSEEKSTKL